jgi:hypothetical protein
MEKPHSQPVEQMSPRLLAFFIAVVWLAAAFGKCAEMRARQALAILLGDSSGAVSSQIWWYGVVFQVAICLLAHKHRREPYRTALGAMLLFWIWFAAYSLGHAAAVVSGPKMH